MNRSALSDNKNNFIDVCREFVEEIDKIYPVSFGYLFGSRAKGTDNSLSDVDIALMFKKKYENSERVFIRGDIIETGRKFFKASVDIVDLEKASLIMRYSVVQEGIIIKDGDHEARTDFESVTLREYFDFQYYSRYYNEAVIKRIKDGTYFGG